MTAVVTELVVTANTAAAVDYTRVMAAAELAAQQATAANNNLAASMRGANDNARDAAETHSRLTLGLRSLAQAALDAAESFAKKVAIGTAAVAVMGALANVLLPLYTAYRLIKTAVDLVTEAWQLGGEQLKKYVELGEKALASGLSTDFFQRISRAAADAKLPVETLAAALAKLQDSTAGKLGGSAAQNGISALAGYGNFGGNAGVGQLAAANGTEEKLRAIVALWDQAIAKGERLAALEAVRVTLGDEIAKKAAADSGFLDRMVVAADAISKAELVSGADVAHATELRDRLDAAEKILSERWHPVQDALTALGIKFREAWVSIVELTASAFDNIAKMVEKLGQVPAWFQDKMNRGATAFMNLTTTPEGRAAAEQSYGISSNQADIDGLAAQQRFDAARGDGSMADARRRLAEGLNRKFDTSKPDPGSPQNEAAAYDRAEEALLKYVEVTKAAAAAVDLTAGAQERLKAIAQLTAAGIKDGLTPAAAAAKAEMSGLAEQAGAAADALARAKIASNIKFGGNTAFLSQDDVAIAASLKSIYPDVATALNSAEAAQMRFNGAARTLSSTIENDLTSGLTDIASGAKSVSQGFSDMGMAVVKAIEQMVIKIAIVTPLMQAMQATASSLGLGSMFGGGSGGLPGTAGSAMFGPIAPSALGNVFEAGNIKPFAAGGVVGGPTLAPMALFGEAGPEAIMPLRRGADGNLGVASAGGSAPQVNVTVIESPNAQGAVSQRQNNNGGIDIEIAVAQIAARSAATPGAALNRVLVDQMGSSQRLAAR